MADGGGASMGDRCAVRASKKALCKFQMSIKFENRLVKAALSNRGSELSSEAIRGRRKCYG